MNCEQILQENMHEKYIQDELSVQENAAYEHHLESCSKCSEGLLKERLLREQIRLAAKEEMKAEIMQQADALRTSAKKIDWMVVYKAAAIFLFVALMPGIVYYYNNIEAPQELNNWQKSGRIEKPVSTLTAEDGKPESIIRSIDSEGLAPAGKGISSAENVDQPILTTSPKPEAQQKSTSAKEKAPVVVERKAKKTPSASQLNSEDQIIVDSEMDESLPLLSKNGQESQSRAQVKPLENAPLQLLETMVSKKQPPVERYSFIPTVVNSRSKSLSKSFQSPGYYRSRNGKIKLKVLVEKSAENKLAYQIKSRNGNALEMNWTFGLPSATLSFSDLQYEIRQDSLMRLFKNDSLFFELNLNRMQGNAIYLMNRE